jgi:hypothetical protein
MCLCTLEIKTATLDLIVLGIRFHDNFKVISEVRNQGNGLKAVAAAASTPAGTTYTNGKQWNNPGKWLSKLSLDSFKGH